ncbi:MAG: aldo/keto reductase [Steroidobacteraceae bacterium]
MNKQFRSGVTRRQAIQGGLAAGVGIALAGCGTLADRSSEGLITKAMPSSGERLPVIGIGAAGFKQDNFENLKVVLQRFNELGGRVIDTSSKYGDSETVIGQALAELGTTRQTFISTKLLAKIPGPLPPGTRPPPPDMLYGAESLERSLRLLKTNHLDLLSVHSMIGIDELMPLLVKWKQAGRIRYIGASSWLVQEHAQLIECMKKYPLDIVEVNYSIAAREAAVTVFPVAIERKIGVIANVPLGQGATIAASRNRPLPPFAAELGCTTWVQLMLKYVVSHPAVICTIPGSTKLEHLEDNQAAGLGKLPDQATRKKLEELWDQAV